jgi:hypothetical protein
MKFGVVMDEDRLKRRYKKFKAKTAAHQEE